MEQEAPVSGAILCDQIKSVDRNARHMEMTPQIVSSRVLQKIDAVIGALLGV